MINSKINLLKNYKVEKPLATIKGGIIGITNDWCNVFSPNDPCRFLGLDKLKDFDFQLARKTGLDLNR